MLMSEKKKYERKNKNIEKAQAYLDKLTKNPYCFLKTSLTGMMKKIFIIISRRKFFYLRKTILLTKKS